MNDGRARLRARVGVRRAFALLGCLVALAALTRTDAPGTGAAFTDTADVSVALQSPDLPAFVPGLVLWLDGADAATQFTDVGCTTPVAAGGDAVRCWRDRSTSEVSLVAASANPATYETARISGNSTVRLAQVGGVEASLVGPDVLGGSADDLQVFLVSRENARGGEHLLSLNGGVVTGAGRVLLNAPWSTGTWDWDAGNATTERAFTGPTAVGATTLATAWKDPVAGSNGLELNGTRQAVSAASTPAVTTGGVRIGYQTPDHDIAEVLVYDRRLAPAEEAALEAYLAAKWGVAVGAAAPGSVAATPSADRAITLSWQAPADDGGSPVTDYVVEYRTQGAGSWTKLADGVSTATSATVTDLTVGTTYELRVAAVTAPGTGAWSAAVTAQALGAWTPADIAAGVGLWLDAADSASLSVSGGVVSEWRDRSGLGRHATQTVPSRRPAFRASDARAGGRPTISAPSNAGTVGLDLPAFTMQRFVGVIGYGTGTQSTFGGFDTLVAGPNSWGEPRFGMAGEGSNSWYASSVLVGSSFANGAAVAGAAVLPMPLGIQRFDLPNATSSAWTLGYNALVATRSWNGPISEVVAFADLSLSTADRQRLEGYLAHRWGTTGRLPADHPHRTVPPLTATPATAPGVPTGLTVVPGDGALALSWAAPGSNGGTAVRDYRVEYRIAGSEGWLTANDGVSTTTTATIADGTSTATSASLTGLTVGTTYEVRVAALNAMGIGPWSTTVTVQALGLWTPVALSGGLDAWYDATDAATLTLVGGAVSQWDDKSGNGRHVSQATDAERPVFQATGFDGRPALDFAGDRLRTTLAGTGASDWTVMAALDADTTAAWQYLFDAETGRLVFAVSSAFNAPGLFNGTSWLGQNTPTTGSQVLGWVLQHPSSAALYRNGALLSGGLAYPTRRAIDGLVSVGGHHQSGGNYFDGRLGELLLVPSATGAADRQRLEGYLAHKWGTTASLPAGHPYRSVPPLTAHPAGVPARPSAGAAVAGDGELRLSWTAPATGPTVTDYVVQYATDSAFTSPVTVADGTSTATTATVTGLTNGTAHWFRVAAANAAGGSGWASAGTATPQPYRTAVLADAPVAYWRLGEPSGTTAHNEVVSGAAGTYAGAPTSITATPLVGDADRGRTFNGTDQHVVAAIPSALTSGTTRSVSAWFRTTGTGIIVGQQSSPTPNGGSTYVPMLWVGTDGLLRASLTWHGSSQATHVNVSPARVDDGLWHHAVATEGPSGIRLYLDGQLVDTRTGLTTSFYGASHLFIGTGRYQGWVGAAASPRFAGSIDEVAVFGTELSGERVAAHHRAGLTGTNDGVAPAAPTGLAATAGNAHVGLSWNAVAAADLAGYRVFRDGVVVRQQVGTTFTDTGLTNGTAYAYTVEAYDTRGNRSSASPAASALPATVPGTVTGLIAQPGVTSVGLTWSAGSTGGSPITDYIIEHRPSGGSWTTLADGVSAATTATITGLTTGAGYEFRVSAVNAVGTGASATATATTAAAWTPADLPGGLTVWFDAADASTVTLNGSAVTAWNDRSGNGRHLTQSTVARQPVSVAASQNGLAGVDFSGNKGLTRTGLTGVTNAWTIAVVKSLTATWGGYHAILERASGGSRIGGLVQHANTGLHWNVYPAAAWQNGSSVALTGTAFTNITAANLLAFAPSTTAMTSLAIGNYDGGASGGSALQYETIALDAAPSVADRQRVEGYLAHKWGTVASLPADHPYKLVPPTTATPATAPAAPTGLIATPAHQSLSLTWTAPASDGGTVVRDYVVRYRTSPSGAWTTFADGVSTATSATITGLAVATAYDVEVVAVNAAGTGAWSTTATATTPSLWTPADLAGGMGAWFDATDAVSITTTGGAVSEWRDRSGNSRHAVQATASARPVVDAAGINSRAAVRFDGTDDRLGLPIPTALPDVYTVVAVFQASGSVGGQQPIYGEYPSAAAWTKNYLYFSGGRVVFDQWSPDGGWAQSGTGYGDTAVLAAFDQTAVNQRSILLHGSSVASSTEAYGGTVPDQVLLGARGGTSPAYLNGRIGELVVVPNGLDVADRQRVEGYLAHKWGTTASLPAGHPYKTTPPVTTTPATAPAAPAALVAVPRDGSVQLSWTAPAAGGTPIRDYVVQYATDSAFTSPVTVADGVSTTTSTTVAGLTTGTPYWFRIAAVNAAGTGAWSASVTATPTTLWTPSNLPGLSLWFDAADAATITAVGGSVSQWADKSGNGRHAVQPSASSQPVATTDAGGRPVVRFAGDGLLLPSLTSLGSTGSVTSVTRFSASGNSVLLSIASSGVRWGWATGATAGHALWYASGTPAVSVDGAAFTGNSFALGTTLGLDTHAVSSNTVDFSGWTGDISLGRFVTSTYNFQGDVQELVFTSSALSTADRQRLEGYLAHKWGTAALLPSDHPYKSAPPRVGVPVAPTAVSATGGDGAVTVQWTAPDAGYGVTDFAVQYKPAASGTWATFADGASTATTATVTGLTAATAYEFRVAAVNAAGTGAWSSTASAMASTAWTPADLTGVALWLDAADAATTVLNGSTVSQWSDKSGNGRHAVQPTASAQPTRIASGQNGRPVLRFDGNRGLLVSAASMTLAQPFERFIAATFQTKASSSVVFDSNNTSNWNYLFNGESGDAGTWVVGAGVRVIGATADFLPHQFWTRVAGTSGYHSVDGASPTGPVNVGTYSLQGATIGHIRSMFASNYGFVGDIHEVLLVSGTLADADRQRVEGYLAHRWGTTSSLPAGHPYKTAPPRVGLPTAPTAFTGQAVGETSVQLQWTAPAAGFGVTDYMVEYLPPAGSWTTFADGTSAATTATVTGLTANTAYDFRVAALGAAGTSAWSSTVTVTPGPAWTPARLTDVAFWLDAADTSTLTLSGTAVAQWSDKSGSGNHAVQATAGSRPTYDSAVQGIDTTGAVWLGFSQQVLAGTTSASMFLVGNQTAGQSSWGMMGCCGSTHSPWSDGRLYDSFASSSRPGAPQALLFPSAGVRTALGYEQTGTELRFWQSGNSLGSAATTYAIPGVGVSQQRIGTMYATSYRLHEVVLVRRLLSTDDRQRLEGYLAHKWGLQAQLPANHPYKTTPPYGS